MINENSDSNKPFEIAIVGNSHAQMYVPSIKPHLVKNKVKAKIKNAEIPKSL